MKNEINFQSNFICQSIIYYELRYFALLRYLTESMGKKLKLIARPLQSTPLDEFRVFGLSCPPLAICPVIWIAL